MPLLSSLPVGLGTGRRYGIGDLPAFNDGDDFVVTDADGWEDPAGPDAVLVANGGGAGAVASGAWQPRERLLTVSGVVTVPADQQPPIRRSLLAAFPADRDTELVGYGNGDEPDLRMFVRRYDRPTFHRLPTCMEFTFPLVAPDPYKYTLTPLVGQMGVFAGQTWYRVYTDTGTKWVRSYALSGSRWMRVYQQLVVSSAYPESLSLDSGGDVASQRVEFVVTGPLTSGEWWLYHETTGRRMWGAFGLTSQQSVVIDCRTKTATLNGSDVSHLIYGDWLTLEPGRNTYQLVGGTASGAYASVTALEAHL